MMTVPLIFRIIWGKHCYLHEFSPENKDHRILYERPL